MTLRLLLLLPLLSICSLRLSAQTYEPGLLVRANGDTLRGEIENGFWQEPPAYIRFRPAADGPSQLFRPGQLRAVSFTGGRYFRSGPFPLDHAAETRFDRLPRNNYFDVRPDTLLAEVLLDGPLSLLRVAWLPATHYLLQRPGQPALDLSARSYLRQVPSGAWLATDGNNFRGQLALYFADCPAARQAALTIPFTLAGLTTVVQTYNEACTPSRQPARSWLAQAGPRCRTAFRGGVLAGVRYNRLSHDGTRYSQDRTCADCRPHPTAGLYAELFPSGRTTALYGELSVGELSVSSYRGASYHAGTFDNGQSYDLHYTYRALLATTRVGGRYFFVRPRERQWLLSLTYELNIPFSPTFGPIIGRGNGTLDQEAHFAVPTLLPVMGAGWRNGPLTLNLEAGLLHSQDTNTLLNLFFGSNFTLRAGVAYRLGRNPDTAAPPQ